MKSLAKGGVAYASQSNHYGIIPSEGIHDGVSIAIGLVGQDLFIQRLAASATGTTTSYRTRVSRNPGRRAAHTESSVYEPPRFAEEADDTEPSPAAGIDVNASTNWVHTDLTKPPGPNS